MNAQPFPSNDPEIVTYSPLKALLVFADGKTTDEWIEEESAPVWLQWMNHKRQRPHNFELRPDSPGLVYDEQIF